MANDYNSKRYYWIKLRENFMTSDAVDFLMGQKDGANYVVLYQMLCLKTINTGGELSRTIGEMVIPYDVDKIARDVKWFNKDTVLVALQLYKKLGLIFTNENGNLVISNYEKMVGSETQSAIYKQEKKQLENFQQDSNRYIDIKILDNKSIDNREIENRKIDNNSIKEYNVLQNDITKEVISRLNELTGANFKSNGKSTKELIKNLLKTYTKEDILMVIDKMVYKWGQDEKMSEYLRPSTLFRISNFENYYGMNIQKKELTTKDLKIDIKDFFKE